jgi:hypothetical protein
MKNIYKILLLIVSVIASVILTSCGDDALVTSEADYKPKIVIEGLIFPGEAVQDIRFSRNYPLDRDINVNDLYLMNAKASITDLESNVTYSLEPNIENMSFGYNGSGLNIGYGKSYRLDVSAEIDGQQLHASSVTTTPLMGFHVIDEESVLGELTYREKNNMGELKKFKIKFAPSSGASFYSFSIDAVEARLDNFVYDNPYFDIDSSDVYDDFLSFKQQYNWLMNLSDTENYEYEVNWLNLWFYSNYRIIAYAGDRNYHHFMATYDDVQEVDGNFHEPKFYIDGEGIGYFGSAIADTVWVKVNR